MCCRVQLGMNASRFSIEWSRVQPKPDVWDESALAHYDAEVDLLLANGITPMITLHHFTQPMYVCTRKWSRYSLTSHLLRSVSLTV